ncbi:unnamed protein product [Caenorhabditis brenneri]
MGSQPSAPLNSSYELSPAAPAPASATVRKARKPTILPVENDDARLQTTQRRSEWKTDTKWIPGTAISGESRRDSPGASKQGEESEQPDNRGCSPLRD